ncbi:MAG: bifunctional folylpolyglutamate synthase/dihydrofolate synthase [Chloroflexi bacterium]|nr:bifunctional folylpolyglutamate synthase/dihydrofolate synthase [Chloroflexota bacterium]
MNEQEALDYILGFTDYERSKTERYSAEQFHLSRMARLLAELGDPHRRIPAVHIAGTKGKGSTAAMIASALRAAGYRVGLFTSPHLHHFRERIQLDGEPIAPAEFAALVERVRPAVERVMAEACHGPVSTFEIATALAFCFFAERDADFQVLEVGLGGRLDATNVVHPLVATITSVSLDHTHILGSTIEAIAREKAGIVKAGGVVVAAPQRPEAMAVIAATAEAQGARLVRVGADVTFAAAEPPARLRPGEAAGIGQRLVVTGRLGRYELRIPLLGRHQQENAAAAVATLECLAEQRVRVTPAAIRQGLETVRWPGRLEIIGSRPLVVADGAHNPDSARRLAEALREYFDYRRLFLILGASADKDVAGIVGELVGVADLILATRSHHPRAAEPVWLAQLVEQAGGPAEICLTVEAALDRAHSLAGPDDLICVTGSLFVAAEAMALMEPVPVA